MSLADVLSISQAATSVALLGDPQQLDQLQKGIHPEGADVSALLHLLDGRATIEEGRGIFLEETRRLHPEICAFISELFYDSRLKARSENLCQRLNSKGPLTDSGLRFVPVEHFANQTESREEVGKVAELVKGL
jgi:superfamily I DNA and/or RNA helicase